MQEVVCFQCGRIVHVSPDEELCSVCGENLRELIHPAYISKYFYDRASALAAGGDLLQALREIDRGLRYADSSELRLLGAILSQRIGDFEQMRQHVAAVPVDDVLRPEAEWLLRSHQTRQRAQRANGNGPKREPSLAELDPLPPLSPSQQGTALAAPALATAEQPQPTRKNSLLVYAGLFVLALLATSALLANRERLPVDLPWLSALSGSVPSANNSQAADLSAPVRQSATASAATATAIVIVGDGTVGDGTVTLQPSTTPLPTIELQVPPDVVDAETPEPLAESTSAIFAPLVPYEIDAYLEENNRPDLAALDVVADSLEGTLLLKGIVPSYRARQDLLTLMEQVPGVTRVSGADLLIRLPAVYEVQPGDTLWAISASLYGENRVDSLLAANQDQLASAEALRVGMELSIPPIE